MKLPSVKSYHCAVSLNEKDLIVIGGYGSGSSSEVLSFDVENMSGGWTILPSMNTPTYGHACDTGSYEGRYGIFVTGGYGKDSILSSVKFYMAQEQRWVVLGAMTTARYGHTLSIVSGLPYAAGGYPFTDPVERLNGTTWE